MRAKLAATVSAGVRVPERWALRIEAIVSVTNLPAGRVSGTGAPADVPLFLRQARMERNSAEWADTRDLRPPLRCLFYGAP